MFHLCSGGLKAGGNVAARVDACEVKQSLIREVRYHFHHKLFGSLTRLDRSPTAVLGGLRCCRANAKRLASSTIGGKTHAVGRRKNRGVLRAKIHGSTCRCDAQQGRLDHGHP